MRSLPRALPLLLASLGLLAPDLLGRAEAGIKLQCRKACLGAIAQCITTTGQRRTVCKRQVLRRCRLEGVQVCAPSTTTTTTSATPTTTVATGCGLLNICPYDSTRCTKDIRTDVNACGPNCEDCTKKTNGASYGCCGGECRYLGGCAPFSGGSCVFEPCGSCGEFCLSVDKPYCCNQGGLLGVCSVVGTFGGCPGL